MLSPMSPYCADFQIRTINPAANETTIYPRRPIKELTRRRLDKMTPASVFVWAIALYDNYDECLHDHCRWLERALGYHLVMKRQRSRKYKKLFDALLVPCAGPRVYAQGAGGVVLLKSAGVEVGK